MGSSGISNILAGICSQFPPGDPNKNALLYWNDTKNDIEFLGLGSGFVIDGSGNLTVGAAAPDGAVQFNQSNALSGNVALRWDYVNNGLIIGGRSNSTARGPLDIIGPNFLTPANISNNFTYNDPSSNGDYNGDGSTFVARIYPYKLVSAVQTFNFGYTETTGVANVSGNPLEWHLSWGAVAGADGYRIYFLEPYNGGDFDPNSGNNFCFDTTATSLTLGQSPSNVEQNFQGIGIPPTPILIGPDLYVDPTTGKLVCNATGSFTEVDTTTLVMNDYILYWTDQFSNRVRLQRNAPGDYVFELCTTVGGSNTRQILQIGRNGQNGSSIISYDPLQAGTFGNNGQAIPYSRASTWTGNNTPGAFQIQSPNGDILIGAQSHDAIYYHYNATLANEYVQIYPQARLNNDLKLITLGKALYIAEGTNGMQGTVPMTAGVATVTIAGLVSTDKVGINLITPAGTLGPRVKAVCTTNTLTITSINTAGLTNTLETSTYSYRITRAA